METMSCSASLMRAYTSRRASTHRSGAQHLTFNIAHILSFVGEHGRHYAKVFDALADELARIRKREGVNIVL